jgi:ABC-type bacteriocin/lantibiotic exporter with double-glycine peptidase domain
VGVIALLVAAGLFLDVPFVPQARDTCGAASLAMVMRYWGADVDHDQIVAEVAEPGEKGFAGSRLAAYAREHGFLAFPHEGDAVTLRDALSKGRPTIVALAAGKGLLHDVVVIGFDEETGRWLVHDPARGRDRRIERRAFEAAWRASGHYALLVVPRP